MKSKKKKSSLKFSATFSAQNQGEEQKKKKGLHSSPKPRRNAQNIPKFDQTLCPTCKKGGACLNFAYFSMQFCNLGTPKGGAWHNAPPLKYAPGYSSGTDGCRKLKFGEVNQQICHFFLERKSSKKFLTECSFKLVRLPHRRSQNFCLGGPKPQITCNDVIRNFQK